MTEAVVDISDMALGQCRFHEVDGHALLVTHTRDGFRVFSGICPHQALTLSEARLRGDVLMCPHHGARFRIETGAPIGTGITSRKLPVYPFRQDGNMLIVTLTPTDMSDEVPRGLPGSIPPKA